MNYWKYPVYKKGDVYQYDWCNMVDELQIERPNYVMERNAIARLLADCGDAVGMDYCMPLNFFDGSFAWPQYARDAFVEDFGYNDNATIIRRKEGGYSDLEWKDRIIRPLMSGCPVFYAAIEEGTIIQGHAFVCDGYIISLDLFHINFGWNGNNNSWYSLENINPDSQYYNGLERAIIWLYPGEDDVFCDYTLDLTMYYNDKIHNGIVQESPFYFVPNTYANLISSREQIGTPNSWRTIPSGETSEYVAHKSVTLLPGFHAERGSNFTAKIVPCTECGNEAIVLMSEPAAGQEDATFNASEMSKAMAIQGDSAGVESQTLYPNPCHETITYQGMDVGQAAIYDLLGKPVFRWFVVSRTDNEIVFDIKDLKAGSYILVLESTDGTYTAKRFIKE